MVTAIWDFEAAASFSSSYSSVADIQYSAAFCRSLSGEPKSRDRSSVTAQRNGLLCPISDIRDETSNTVLQLLAKLNSNNSSSSRARSFHFVCSRRSCHPKILESNRRARSPPHQSNYTSEICTTAIWALLQNSLPRKKDYLRPNEPAD